MKLFRLLDRALVDYNFFIAFAAVALLFLVDFLFESHLAKTDYGFIFASTLLTYNLFRTPIQSIDSFFQTQKLRLILLILSAILAFGCFIQFNRGLQLSFLVLGTVTSSYKFSFFKLKPLREIPFLKLPIITAVWITSVALFFVHEPMNPFLKTEFHVFLYMQVFLFIAITIPFDVFGLNEDEMPTIPNHFGVQKALFFSKIAILIYGMLPLIFGIKRMLIPAITVTMISFLVIQATQQLKNKAMQYYFLDGIIIMQTVVYFLYKTYFIDRSFHN